MHSANAPCTCAGTLPASSPTESSTPYFREAFALVQEGVCDYAERGRDDEGGGLGARWAAIGPFESLDLAGLDVYEAVASRLYPLLANYGEPAYFRYLELVAEGHLGCKTGRGLYGDYDDEAIGALRRRRAQVLLALERLNTSSGMPGAETAYSLCIHGSNPHFS